MSDRIDAGVFAMAAAITGGELSLVGASLEHFGVVRWKLEQMGVEFAPNGAVLQVRRERTLRPINVITSPYPGFATDLQSPIMALSCLAEGTSYIRETIFDGRYRLVGELNKIGAKVEVDSGNVVIVHGPSTLKGTKVVAHDLRTGIALILAGLGAEGETWSRRDTSSTGATPQSRSGSPRWAPTSPPRKAADLRSCLASGLTGSLLAGERPGRNLGWPAANLTRPGRRPTWQAPISGRAGPATRVRCTKRRFVFPGQRGPDTKYTMVQSLQRKGLTVTSQHRNLPAAGGSFGVTGSLNACPPCRARVVCAATGQPPAPGGGRP